MKNSLSFIISFLVIYVVYGYDYVLIQKEHCKKGKRHIVVHPEQMRTKAGPDDIPFTESYNILPMTSKVRNAIVDAHNEVRNELACGNVVDKAGEKYPPAAHMRELIWDKELEYIALKHAEVCVFEHDECRTSSKYKMAGQNLAVRYADHKDMIDFVKDFVKKWYLEYKDATVSDILKLHGTKGVGHFTQLSLDRATRVGCAVSRCKKEDETKYILYTCDYSASNVMGFAVYKNSTEPANNCKFVKSTKSKKYECLCENNDHFWSLFE